MQAKNCCTIFHPITHYHFQKCLFYEINDDNSFINGLMKASKSQNLKVNNIEQITLKNRAREYLNL